MAYPAQQNYGPVFDALMPYFDSIHASMPGLLRPSISGSIGEYAVVTTMNGQQKLYFVYCAQDDDGVWRREAM